MTQPQDGCAFDRGCIRAGSTAIPEASFLQFTSFFPCIGAPAFSQFRCLYPVIKKRIILTCLLLSASTLYADQTTVSFDSGGQAIYDQNTGAMNALSGGTAANGDGTVLQLGYYDAATTANNFAGNWVPLSGEGSLNTAVIPGGPVTNPTNETYNQTSIGDLTANGAGNATFAISLNFVAGNATSGNSLPSSTTIPLALRFYNGASIATSTFYNVVSDDLWLWKTPNTPPVNVNISLNDLNLEWLSIGLGQAGNTAFHTTIPLSQIPEPGTIAAASACAVGLVVAALRRRRKSC